MDSVGGTRVKVFVSYSHRDGAWVLDRLVPVLKAGGVDVRVDVERFRVGGSVIGEMDATQDAADKSLLVLSHAYLTSDYCWHEMVRAVARDPDFSRFLTIPIRRDDAPFPAELDGAIYAGLVDDAQVKPWRDVLVGCEADLGATAPAWLEARDAVADALGRHRSVNRVVRGDAPRWRPLLDDIREHRVKELGVVDLQNPGTSTRDGLLVEILRSVGLRVTSLSRKPRDLLDFSDQLLALRRKVRVAVTHSDLFPHRRAYDIDLFSTLRWLVMEEDRPLTLLAQSRRPFRSCYRRGTHYPR
jgi:hypothetical protein